MGTVEVATRMRRLVLAYNLKGLWFVTNFTDENLAAAFNGIGPEWFPAVLRSALDALHEDLIPVAFVHDVRWAYSDGTRTWFDMSNDEFEYNGRKVADALYGWYDPRRYIRRSQSKVFAELCRRFGWSAYEQAFKVSQKEYV